MTSTSAVEAAHPLDARQWTLSWIQGMPILKLMADKYFDVVIEHDEAGWYIAHVPALRGCHTQGETLDEVEANVREAIEGFLAAGAVPEPRTLTIERIAIAA
jgi:predicted RNase H-like HicB family nuclease